VTAPRPSRERVHAHRRHGLAEVAFGRADFVPLTYTRPMRKLLVIAAVAVGVLLLRRRSPLPEGTWEPIRHP